ncbi:MAG TPA: hypothetical protein VGG72_34845 [Bryobacteraceae bacterium]|jgi:hypothetical protein
MNEALISAVAALTGSALGGITPIISNYLVQRGLTERELFTRQLAERQELYSEFIRFGAKVYVSATTQEPKDENFDDLTALYALVSRIRLYASPPVIEAAQDFASLVTEEYGRPAISIEALRSAALNQHVNPLSKFSIQCRQELEETRRHYSRGTA